MGIGRRAWPTYLSVGVGNFRESFGKASWSLCAGVPTGKRAVDRRKTVATITSLVAKSLDEILGGFGVALTRVKTVGVGSPSVAM